MNTVVKKGHTVAIMPALNHGLEDAIWWWSEE